MNLVPALSWFANLRRQRLQHAAPPDFGNMGTAFGLDASFDSEPPTIPAVFMKNGCPETGATQQRRSRVDQRIDLHARR